MAARPPAVGGAVAAGGLWGCGGLGFGGFEGLGQMRNSGVLSAWGGGSQDRCGRLGSSYRGQLGQLSAVSLSASREVTKFSCNPQLRP